MNNCYLLYVLWKLYSSFLSLLPKKISRVCSEWCLVNLCYQQRQSFGKHRNPLWFAYFPSFEVEVTGLKTTELESAVSHRCDTLRWNRPAVQEMEGIFLAGLLLEHQSLFQRKKLFIVPSFLVLFLKLFCCQTCC